MMGLEQHMRTSISLLPRQARTAGSLHGVLGQAPPSFQVLLRVFPEPARPAQWGQAPLWPERQVLEGEISDAVVVFAGAPRRLHFAGGASIRVRRATHLSTPLNITRKHDQIESSDDFHPPSWPKNIIACPSCVCGFFGSGLSFGS